MLVSRPLSHLSFTTCRPHDGTVLFVVFRWFGLFRELGATKEHLLSCPHWPDFHLSVIHPWIVAVECEREEVMVRSTPSFRTARHYGSFLLIFVSGAALLLLAACCLLLAACCLLLAACCLLLAAWHSGQPYLPHLPYCCPPPLQIMAMSYAVIGPLILPIAVVFFCTSLVRMYAAWCMQQPWRAAVLLSDCFMACVTWSLIQCYEPHTAS